MILSWGSRSVALFSQLLLTRILGQELGPDGYGLYAYVFALVALGNMLDFGMALALQNRVSMLKANGAGGASVYSKVLGLVAVTGTATFLVLLGVVGLADYIIPSLLPEHWPGLLLLSVLYGYSQIYVRTLFAESAGQWVFAGQALVAAGFLAICFAASVLLPRQVSPLAFVAAYFVIYVAVNVILAIAKGTGGDGLRWNFRFRFLLKEIRAGSSYWVFVLIGFFSTQLDVIVLGALGMVEELGYYAILAKVFFGVCYSFTSIVFSLAHPEIAMASAKSDMPNMRRIVRSTAAMAGLILVAFLLAFELGKPLIVPLLAPGFDPAVFSQAWVYVYFVFFTFRVISDGGQTFFLARSQPRVAIRVGILQAIVSGGLLLVLVPQLGLLGAAISLSVSYGLSSVLYTALILRPVQSLESA